MTGAAHEQTFSVKCTVILMGNLSCVGSGVSRKRAEQDAAEKMLKLINKQKK